MKLIPQQTSSYARFVQKAIFGLAVIAILSQLFVWAGTLYPYLFPKAWLFRLAVEAMLFLYIPLALLDREYLPRRSLLVLAAGTFAGSLLISAVFGVSFYKSFWSNAERMEGLFGILHYAAFFVVLAGAFRRAPEKLLNLAKVFVGVGVIAVFSGIWDVLETGYIRLSGVAGNPSFLAVELLFAGGFSLFIGTLASSKLQRVFWYGTGLFLFGSIVFTGTRGAVLGLVSGFVTLAAWIGVWRWRYYPSAGPPGVPPVYCSLWALSPASSRSG